MNTRALTRAILLGVAASLAILVLTSGPGRRVEPPHAASRVVTGGLSLRSVRSGSGTPVILLHGFGESLLTWRGLFDLLAAHADVIALDLPGFGLSTKPPTGYGVEQLANTVLAASSAMGVDSFVLVGHSLGGAVAAAVALEAPGRVIALVLVDPAGVGTPEMLPDSGSLGMSAARAAVAEYEAQRTRFAMAHDPGWLAEDSADLAYLPAQDPRYRAALTAVLREFDFGFLTADRAARLSVPTLIIWGAFDAVLPLAHGRWLAERVPGARLVVIDRAWHRPQVERPAETADTVLAFLNAAVGRDSH